MPYTIEGNNSFEDVPLVLPEQTRWAGTVEMCDPLLRQVAVVGISAVQAGIEQADDPRIAEFAASQPLFGVDERARTDFLDMLYDDPNTDRGHQDLAAAGVRIATAATQVSRLLRSSPGFIENGDYTGPFGAKFLQRTVSAAIPYRDQQDRAGDILNSRPVTVMHARILRPAAAAETPFGTSELSLLATTREPDGKAYKSLSLKTNSDPSSGTVSAHILGSTHHDGFGSVHEYTNFDNLQPFAANIARLAR
jgi:hypothetical protein